MVPVTNPTAAVQRATQTQTRGSASSSIPRHTNELILHMLDGSREIAIGTRNLDIVPTSILSDMNLVDDSGKNEEGELEDFEDHMKAQIGNLNTPQPNIL